MARIKEHYLGNMTQSEIDSYLYDRNIRELEYQEWTESDDYINMINEELINYKPQYSVSDINESICYAFESVKVTQSEVGSDVYGKLIHEKVFEYLNNQNER